ncbi:unnamed protein product [Caenorhabditis auriculariae]|uniref:SHSP domain-containing protein n=1 Tax=Caenorhabditis auriculariae TaxID=2777116 RepID=A0A8S1HBB9_9PELO|nr:unnamed protein product [Caenorhabditis auriculariae]
MALSHFGGQRSPFDSIYREMRDLEHSMINPYWHRANHLNFNSAADVGVVVNDENKYGLNLDVSHFRPEELKVHLDGRTVTVEGSHESHTEHGTTKRSFVRSFLLPEDVDIAAVHSSLTNDGHLAIEAPKAATSRGRSIPIGRAIENGKQQQQQANTKKSKEKLNLFLNFQNA